jgi:hypothetical protein
MGVLVGALMVFSAATAANLGGAPHAPPAPVAPFWFNMVVTGQYTAPNGDVYNLSASSISNPNLTLGWIQFYILTGTGRNVSFAVSVYTSNHSLAGEFNSSDSTWSGPASPSNSTLESFGGWAFGKNSTFSLSDAFQLTSDSSLSGYDLDIGMQIPGSSEDRGMISLEL